MSKKKAIKIGGANIPFMYGDNIPFNDFQLLKDWDDSMHSDPLPEPKPTFNDAEKAEYLRLEAAKLKFDRYVRNSTFCNSNVFGNVWFGILKLFETMYHYCKFLRMKSTAI